MENGFREANIPTEQSLACVRAAVMLFDNDTRSWNPVGANPSLSNVKIVCQQLDSAHRILGVRLDNGEVSLNEEVRLGLSYHRATPVFHQWKQGGRITGLHFQTEAEATEFSDAVESTLERLSNSEKDCRSLDFVEVESRPTMIIRPRRQIPNSSSHSTTTSSSSSSSSPSPITTVASNPVIRINDTTTETVETTARTTGETTKTNGATVALPGATSESTETTTTTTAAEEAGRDKTEADKMTTSASASALSALPSSSISTTKYQTSFRFVPKSSTATSTATTTTTASTNDELSSASTPTSRMGTGDDDVTPRSLAVSTWTPAAPGRSKEADTNAPMATVGGQCNSTEYPTNSVSSSTSLTPSVSPSQEAETFVPPPPPPPPAPPAPPAPLVYASNAYVGLGSALQNAQLRRSPKPDDEPGCLVRSASPSLSDLQSDMMSEMARKLKERKAKASMAPAVASPVSPKPDNVQAPAPAQMEPLSFHERRMSFDRGSQERRGSIDRSRSPVPLPLSSSSSSTNRPPAAVANGAAAESPKFPRSRRIQSLTGQEVVCPPATTSGPTSASSCVTGSVAVGYVTSAELEATKQELMSFVRNEISRAKQEIIDAVRRLLMKQQ